jgi:hypothetical protein
MNRTNHTAGSGIIIAATNGSTRAKSAIPAVLVGLAAFWFFDVTLSSGQSAGAHRGTWEGSTAAIEQFWTTFHGNDYDSIPAVQAALQAALARDPENVTLTALLGATHFWHVGESTRDPRPDLNVLQQDMPIAVQLFQKALNLDYGPQPIGHEYNDHLPGFLGVTTVHLGHKLGDPALIAKGDQLLDYSVYQFPEFNNFNRWAAHSGDPAGNASYKKALDSLWQALDTCIGGAIDRTNPDIRPYLYLQTSVGRKSTCWSENQMAPHSLEGLMLNLGNGLVKAGQINIARIVYANAKYAENYASWPYRQALESIAASDLTARAALYADTDPTNDPPLTVPNRSCVYCHATATEPKSASQ